MKTSRTNYKPYPSDVSEEEWSFVAPYLTLNRLDGENRKHDLRAVFNALRWLVRSGAHWRMMPHEFPPWPAVYQQMRRWLEAGCFEAMVHDLRVLLREYAGRKGQPSAVILDSRTLQSTPESGARAGYDGAKRRKGAKVHAAVDTLGHLLALHVTPANEQDRAQVKHLARAVQKLTGKSVDLAYVDQGYTGETAHQAAQTQGIELAVVKHTEVKRGFVLLPRRWVVERSFGWAARFRRLARWSNAASVGQRASAVWRATMSDSHKLLPGCTTSPSPALCFIVSSPSSTQVHNRL